MGFDLELDGLIKAQEYLDEVAIELHGAPMVSAMRQASMLVSNEAKRLVPVDTGYLRASITPEVRTEQNELIGAIGSNVLYAPYVETGTRPHWPPKGALAVWARRHGWKEGSIRYIIGTRGTQAHPYLVPAIQGNAATIYRILDRGVSSVVEG